MLGVRHTSPTRRATTEKPHYVGEQATGNCTEFENILFFPRFAFRCTDWMTRCERYSSHRGVWSAGATMVQRPGSEHARQKSSGKPGNRAKLGLNAGRTARPAHYAPFDRTICPFEPPLNSVMPPHPLLWPEQASIIGSCLLISTSKTPSGLATAYPVATGPATTAYSCRLDCPPTPPQPVSLILGGMAACAACL